MSRTKSGGHNSIIRKVYTELNGKVSEEDINKVVTMFWGVRGVQRYLKGYKSFSVKKFFFFYVHRNKIQLALERWRKNRIKTNKKYYKKLKKRKKKEKLL